MLASHIKTIENMLSDVTIEYNALTSVLHAVLTAYTSSPQEYSPEHEESIKSNIANITKKIDSLSRQMSNYQKRLSIASKLKDYKFQVHSMFDEQIPPIHLLNSKITLTVY